MLRRLVAAAAMLLLATCTVPNPEYCDATRGCAEGFLCDLAGSLSSDGRTNVCVRQTSCETDPDLCVAPTPICSAGLCVACVGPADCTAPGVGICDEGVCRGCEMDMECTAPGLGRCLGGGCVECRDGGDCAGGTLCDAVDHVCRGCETDAECASGVCDVETVRCVAEGQVAHVVQGSPAGNTECTRTAPCDTPEKGLTRAQAIGQNAWVLLGGGNWMVNLTVTQNVSIGGSAAVLRASSAATPVLTIGPGGSVRLQGVEVRGAGMATSAVRCQGTLDTTLATLALRGVTIANNAGIGLSAFYCDLTVERSRIQDNPQGGIDLERTNFTLVNNLIRDNGTAGTAGSSTTFGGLNVRNSPYPAPTRARFEHNTVVSNKIRDTIPGGAVRCEEAFGTVTLRSSILYDNTGNAAQVSPACAVAYSDVGQAGISGTGVINMPPLLDGNFRLTAASPCLDKADPLSTVPIDFEGEPRPTGTADMGWDER